MTLKRNQFKTLIMNDKNKFKSFLRKRYSFDNVNGMYSTVKFRENIHDLISPKQINSSYTKNKQNDDHEYF